MVYGIIEAFLKSIKIAPAITLLLSMDSFYISFTSLDLSVTALVLLQNTSQVWV